MVGSVAFDHHGIFLARKCGIAEVSLQIGEAVIWKPQCRNRATKWLTFGQKPRGGELVLILKLIL